MDNKPNYKTVSVIASILIAGLLIALIVWMINNNREVENISTGQESSEVTDEQESMITRITDNPADYVGKTVTVRGEVQDVLTERIFKISDNAVGDELTVITPAALTTAQATQAEEFLRDNSNVEVIGDLRLATVAEIESDYGYELGSEIEAEFENTYVLVADSIDFIDETDGLWQFDSDEARMEDTQN